MGLSKITSTSASEANTAILILNQYGMRARMTWPRASILATTHRESVGNTRTLTFAVNHDMAVGDYLLPGGLPAAYNQTTAHRLFPVTAVPAPNKLSYTHTTVTTETITEDTAGRVIKLGWTRLRIGMRCSLIASANVTGPSNAWGLGVGLGQYPVSSGNCLYWSGMTNYTYGGHNYTSTPPANIYKSSTDYYVNAKYATTWTYMNGYIGPYSLSASREHPCGFFIEYHKSGTDGTWRLTNGIWRPLNFTKAKFLSVLKYPDALISSIAGMNAVSLNTIGSGDHSLMPYGYLISSDLEAYLEVFTRFPDNNMEIMDIGYCLIP